MNTLTPLLTRDWDAVTGWGPARRPPATPPPRYLIGLDLGQAADYSALAVARLDADPAESPATITIGHLARYPIGTPYPAIVDDVVAMCSRPELAPGERPDPPTLLIDATGVGRPVVDLFVRSRPHARIKAVTITGGHEPRAEGGSLWVPKKDLVSAVQATLQSDRLKVVPSLEHAPTLRAELLNFRVKITTAANESFGAWREADHDDLVLAVAMIAWHAERFRPQRVRIYC